MNEEEELYLAAAACMIRYFNQTRHEIVITKGKPDAW